jgi:hypothetical protein
VSELGLNRTDLIRRTRYKNVAKGLRRLDELFAGNLDQTVDLIRALPDALNMPGHLVETAVAETRHELREYALRIAQEEEKAWRSAFVPHAVILTDRTRPQRGCCVSILTSLLDARAISIRRSMEFGSNWRNSNLRSRESLRSFLLSADQSALS